MAIVLGYHGCDRPTAQLPLGGSPFEPSNKPHDWLGTGAYFWESDIKRAFDWATERRPQSPCVVGAVIESANCLDLTQQAGILAVEQAFNSYVKLQLRTGQPIAVNRVAPGTYAMDRVLRLLDRAVLEHLHASNKMLSQETGGRVKEFDTVRALFPEGEELYPNSGFRKKTHIQIAVKNASCIRGVFRVPSRELAELGIPPLYPN